MATRCYIGILNQETYLVDYVYCHFDGYLEGVGRTLISHYDNANKINELLSHGNMSSLGINIHDCCFYMRDRKEENCDAMVLKLHDFFKLGEILYLYKDNEWFSNDCDSKENEFMPVEETLIQQMKDSQNFGEFVRMHINNNLCVNCSKEKDCNLKFKSGIFNSCLRFLEHVTL